MPAGDPGPRGDRASCLIACLPIGRAWTTPVREQTEALCAALPARFRVSVSEPVLGEVDILERAEQLCAQKPDVLLLVALHGGSARAMLLAARTTGVPALVLCHDEDHSLASACLAMEALRQLGHPCALIHGWGAAAAHELASGAAAAGALRRLARARIGQVGPVHPNLVPCAVNPLAIQKTFGSWIVPIAVSEVRRKVASVDPGRVAENLRVLRKRFLVEAEGDPMEKGVRLHLALADIAKEQRLDSLSVDCWTEILPEFGVSPCLGFAFESCRIACEGDLLLALALLAGEALGGSPGYAGDLYAIDEQRGWATSVHCGACAELQGTRDPIAIVSCAPPRTVTGHGAVLSVRPVLPAGGATVAMFHGANANQLHVRAAKIIDTSFAADMRVRFSIEGDAGAFRREAAGNHYAIFPGDASPAWRLLATWLGITAH